MADWDCAVWNSQAFTRQQGCNSGGILGNSSAALILSIILSLSFVFWWSFASNLTNQLDCSLEEKDEGEVESKGKGPRTHLKLKVLGELTEPLLKCSSALLHSWRS